MHAHPLLRISSLFIIMMLISSCSRTTPSSSLKIINANLAGMKNNLIRANSRIFKQNKPRYPAALPLRGYPGRNNQAKAKRVTQTHINQKRPRYPAALPLRKSNSPRVCPTPNRRVVLARGSIPRISAQANRARPAQAKYAPPRQPVQARQLQQKSRPQAPVRTVKPLPRINTQQANQQLFALAKNGNSQQVNNILSQGANVNSANSSGETALHAAASTGNTSTAQALLQHGANVNARTVRGWTPLHTAARFGRGNFVALLLSRGAIRSIKNTDGKTPAQLATQANQQAIVNILQR